MPRLPTIILTDLADIETAVAAMKLGVLDVLEAPYSNKLLLEVLDRGFTALSSAAVEPDYMRDRDRYFGQLTKRQRQVLFGLGRGYTNKAIASRLDIRPRTVEMHRADLMARLGINNLAELVRFALAVDFGSLEATTFASEADVSHTAVRPTQR